MVLYPAPRGLGAAWGGWRNMRRRCGQLTGEFHYPALFRPGIAVGLPFPPFLSLASCSTFDTYRYQLLQIYRDDRANIANVTREPTFHLPSSRTTSSAIVASSSIPFTLKDAIPSSYQNSAPSHDSGGMYSTLPSLRPLFASCPAGIKNKQDIS